MGETLSYIRALRAESTFESAARHVVQHLGAALESRQPAARLQGGFLQMRFAESERAIYIGECDRVSATLRAAVSEGAAVLAVAQDALFFAQDGFTTPQRLSRRSFASRPLLSARGVGFVLGLPLRYVGGELLGVVGLELALNPGVGPEHLARPAELLAELAELALDVLRARPPGGARAVERMGLPAMSPALEAFLANIEPFANVDEPLLLHGAAGLGQAQIARWIHDRSGRPNGFHAARFELSGDWLGQSLFGWATPPPGAPPGAYGGLLGEARRGTVFIDAVERLSLPMQAQLLRALETGRYHPDGERRPRRCQARLIVGIRSLDAVEAVHPELWRQVGWARFRIPPLARRAEEIPDWARAFLATAGGDVALAPDAAKALMGRAWIGNLDALEQAVRRARILAMRSGEARVVIQRWHVQQALDRDASTGDRLRAAMQSAAALFLDAREELGDALTLDRAGWLRHDVEIAAVERYGGKNEAYARLGRHTAVARANHHRDYRTAKTRIKTLEDCVHPEPPA